MIFKRCCVCIVHHLNDYSKTGTSGSTSAPQVDGCTLALPDSKVSVSLLYLGKTTITDGGSTALLTGNTAHTVYTAYTAGLDWSGYFLDC